MYASKKRMFVAVRGLMLSRQLSELTGHSAAVVGSCLVAGKRLLAECGCSSGEAVAMPVVQ